MQSCHALREFVQDHPEIDRAWYDTSNYLALLSVPTERDLDALIKKASAKGVRFSVFREPDIGNEITAIVLEPKGKRLCGNLQLALREHHEDRRTGNGKRILHEELADQFCHSTER